MAVRDPVTGRWLPGNPGAQEGRVTRRSRAPEMTRMLYRIVALHADPGSHRERSGSTGPRFSRVGLRIVLFEMLWGGGENLAFIGADLNRWSTPCRS
jgi:hypothetical protein